MNNLVLSIYSLLSTPTQEGNNSCFLTSPFISAGIKNFFCNQPFIVSLVSIFIILSMVVAAIAALTGNLQKIIDNLQKIIDFFKNNFTRTTVEVDNDELLKYRKQLLPILKNDILTRQKNSLHELIQIDIQKEEERSQVGKTTSILISEDETKQENNNLLNRVFRPFRSLISRDRNETELKPKQKIIDFYEREDIQGKLLILGDPGAGKTTELISLAKDLIETAINNETASIPIIFELSSWQEGLSIEACK